MSGIKNRGIKSQDVRIYKRRQMSQRERKPPTVFDKAFGRVEYVTEVEAAAIRKINKARQTEYKKRCLIVNRQIEDHQMCKGFGITDKELNQHRRVG